MTDNREEIERSRELAFKIFEWFEAQGIEMNVGLPALAATIGMACADVSEQTATDLDKLLSDVSNEIRGYALLRGME